MFVGGEDRDFLADGFEEHGFVGDFELVFCGVLKGFLEGWVVGGLRGLGGEKFVAVVGFVDFWAADFFDGGSEGMAENGGAVSGGGFDDRGDFFLGN